ncbi:hypothetical protein HanIR_Chr07g0333341 [Helianthus annuus]|nr:hypothetical protein HanIR_Chr07g0333341 [Helianthus annuus]
MQFFMGLDSVYQFVRTNLFIKDPLPSVKEAFSIISWEESQEIQRLICQKNKMLVFFLFFFFFLLTLIPLLIIERNLVRV